MNEKDHMNKMKSWINEHMIIFWGLVSVIFAVIIQILFSIPAKCDLFDAKWEAGDILTYVSTVSLSLLAVWQNKKFKEENDVAQKRLEELTKRANEISLINKIYDAQQTKYLRLKKALDRYSEISYPVYLANILTVGVHKGVAAQSVLVSSFTEISSELDELYNLIIYDITSLKIEKTLKDDFSSCFEKLHKVVCACIRNLITAIGKSKKINPSSLLRMLPQHKDVGEMFRKYTKAKLTILFALEINMDLMLYEDMTLEQIKKMYNSEYFISEDENDGKNANANT